MFSGSQRDKLWSGLEAHVVLKLVRKDRDEASFLHLVNRQDQSSLSNEESNNLLNVE